jgi:4-methylaminobutanoate oxidase (formaldehyde-forming)
MRTTATLARLNDRSAALYSSIEAEGELPTGWREVGGMTVARTKERMVQLRRAGSMATRFGVAVHELSADEVRERWPLASLDDVVGGVWLPNDGIVDPPALAVAVADAARRRGVQVREGSRVTELLTRDGRVTGVRTAGGTVSATLVVLCTGMWTRQLTKGLSIDIPLHPVEHHYVLSHSVGEDITGLPVTRDPDGSIYFRGRGDAILLGAFQRVSKPWLVDRIPDDFSFSLLEPDWDHFADPLEEGLRRVPQLRSLGIERFVNGPESFTPDGNPLVGELPGIHGLYVCAAFNSSGLAYSGGVAEALAQWIVAGEPPFDLWPVDVCRFSYEQSDIRYLRERSVEVLGTHMRMAYPNAEFETGRNLRLSPLHGELAEAGACFGEKCGAERPLWFAGGGQAPTMRYAFGRQNWFECSAAEHAATREAAAIFDQSGFAKYLVRGAGALDLLQRACANNLDVELGRVVYTPMLTSRGTFASDLTVSHTAPEEYLVVSGTAQVVHDAAWLRRFIAEGRDVTLEDISADYAVLGVMGPAAREILEPLADSDLSDDAFPFATTRLMTLQEIPVRAVRMTYVGELGWELHVPRADAVALYHAIVAEGRAYGLVNGGHYAINSLRLEKGYRAWGTDITLNDTPLEAGLAFTVAWDKMPRFHGREALLAQRDVNPPRRALVSLVMEDPEPILWGGELILSGDRTVGYTTSGAYGHTLGCSTALGWVDTDGQAVSDGFFAAEEYEVDIAGERFSVRASLSAPYDPIRLRILC